MTILHHRRLLMLLLAIALFVLSFLVPKPDSREPLAVAIGVWPGAETLVLARERRLLPADQVKLVEMTWDSAGMRALGNRVVDAAVLSLDEVLRLRESGYDVRVVLVFDQSLGGDAILARPEVKSVGDLRGKRVGVDIRAAGMFLLAAALEKHGLSSADVTAVPMGTQDMGDALSAGEVDAIVSVEPWLTQVRAAGVDVLFESRELTPPVTRVLVTFSDVVRAQQTRLALLVKAHFDLLKVLQRGDPAEPGINVVARRERTDAAGFQHSLQQIRLVDLDQNRKWLGKNDTDLKRMAGEVERVMIRAGLLHGSIEASDWTDDTFLPRP